LFGEPQDIEWALADGEFVVLQSRPITSLVSLPVPRPDDDRLHVYLSLGHGQAMTDPMPPLALDLWETVYGEVMNGFTGSNRVWITRTEGRAYMDITPFLGFRQTREGIVETIAAVSRSAAEGTEQLLAERRGSSISICRSQRSRHCSVRPPACSRFSLGCSGKGSPRSFAGRQASTSS